MWRAGGYSLRSQIATQETLSGIAQKTDGAARRLCLGQWLHQFANGPKYLSELSIVFLLHLAQSPHDLFVTGRELAQLHESSHDDDIYGYGTIAVQYARKHRHALLSKNVGQVLAVPPAF